MKIDEIKRIAEARTPWKKMSISRLSAEDIDFFHMAANKIDALIKVAEAAKKACENIEIVYTVKGGLAVTNQYNVLGEYDMLDGLKDALKELEE